MSDVTFVQGDTAPPVTGQIFRQDGSARDLTDADSVRFQMRKPDDRQMTVDQEADVTVAIQGRVSYDWDTHDLSVPGEYVAQWEIHWSDGKIQTTQPPNTITVRKQ